jgi:glutaryl-CoA dehydrogenase
MSSTFSGVDFYDFNSLLSEEERAVQDMVRTWVDENLMPIIGQCYIEGRFPKELIPQMAELGFFGAKRDSLLCFGAGRPGDVPHPCVWL